MKKTLLRLSLFLISFQVESHDPLCESFYQLKFNSDQLSLHSDLAKKNIQRLNLQIASSNDLALKMDLIEYQFKHLRNNIYQKQEELTKMARESKTIYSQDMIDEEINTILFKSLPHIESITLALAKTLRQSNISIKMIKTPLATPRDGVFYNAIEIDLSKKSSKKSIQYLQRLQKKLSLTTFRIDLPSLIQSNAAGMFLGQKSQVQLGPRAIRHILIDDLVFSTTKHELKHAVFFKKRTLRIPSPFHTVYMSPGDSPLSKYTRVYRHHMSAEEVYTISNNSFWGTSRLKNVQSFKYPDITKDINSTYEEVQKVRAISKQTLKLTTSFIEVLKDLKHHTIAKGDNYLSFVNAFHEKTIIPNDISFVLIRDPDLNHYMLGFMDKNIFPTVKKYLDTYTKLHKSYNAEVSRGATPMTPGEISELKAIYSEKGALATQKEQLLIIEHLIKNQESLQSISKKLLKNLINFERYQVQFIKDINRAKLENPQFYKSPYWIQKFREHVQRSRKFGSIVRSHSNK